MPKDNTLGAPTEGLGQSVTFQATERGGISQLQPLRLGDVRNDLRGGKAGFTGQQIQIDNGPGDRVMETLARLGGEMLKPHIEQARNEAYLDGVRKVATGTAVKEIVDEQPWFSKVFGPTPVVEGARAFASFSKAQEESLKIEAEMPELRKLSPKEFQSTVASRMASVSTGDTGTDQLVMQSLVKELPGLMKQHAKEHIGFQQQQFAQQAYNAQATAAGRYAAVAARYNPEAANLDSMMGNDLGTFSDDGDLLEAKIKFVSAFEPVTGVPAETHAKITTKVVADLLSQRNLAAYYTLDEAGALAALPPESQTRLREQADRAESRARAEMPAQLIDSLAAIKTMPSLYDEKGINTTLKSSIDKLNAAYKQYTGGKEPLIQGNTAAELRSSLMSNQVAAERRATEAWERANAREAEKARDKADRETKKYLDAADKERLRQQAIFEAAGILLRGEPTSRLKAEQARDAWDYLRTDPAKLNAARVATVHLGEADKDGQGSIRSAAQNAVTFDAFEALYQKEYAPLVAAAKGSEHVAKVYFGDFADKFSQYHSMRKTSSDANAAAAAFTIATSNNKPLNKAKDSDDQLGLAAVKAATGGTFFGLFGKEADPRFAEELWKNHIKPLATNRPGKLEDNVQAAIRTQQQEGLEFTGKYFWKGTEANSFKSLLTGKDVQLRVTGTTRPEDMLHPDQFADAVNAAVDGLGEKLGLSSSTLKTVLVRDNKGQISLSVFGVGADGYYQMHSLSADRIYGDELARRKAAEGKVMGIPYKFGPQITYRPEQGAPSIYASPEDWAKYRASNKK